MAVPVVVMVTTVIGKVTVRHCVLDIVLLLDIVCQTMQVNDADLSLSTCRAVQSLPT
jgi:hypothetical protein